MLRERYLQNIFLIIQKLKYLINCDEMAGACLELFILMLQCIIIYENMYLF